MAGGNVTTQALSSWRLPCIVVLSCALPLLADSPLSPTPADAVALGAAPPVSAQAVEPSRERARLLVAFPGLAHFFTDSREPQTREVRQGSRLSWGWSRPAPPVPPAGLQPDLEERWAPPGPKRREGSTVLHAPTASGAVVVTDVSVTVVFRPRTTGGGTLRAEGGLLRCDSVAPSTTFAWSPGGGAITYDLLRSTSASDFLRAGCVVSGQNGTSATDAAAPSPILYYLVRSRNLCGGNLGRRSDGTPRSGALCP